MILVFLFQFYMMNIDRYNPLNQKLFGILNFKSAKGSWDKKIWEPPPQRYAIANFKTYMNNKYIEHKIPGKESYKVLLQPVSWTGWRQRRNDLWEGINLCLQRLPSWF